MRQCAGVQEGGRLKPAPTNDPLHCVSDRAKALSHTDHAATLSDRAPFDFAQGKSALSDKDAA